MPHSIENTGSQALSKYIPIVSEEEYVSTITRYEVHIENLDSIVIQSGALLEGDCFYQTMTPVKRSELLPKQRNLFSVARVGDRIMEIGFNAGHSELLFLLANPCSKITCFDLCTHSHIKNDDRSDYQAQAILKEEDMGSDEIALTLHIDGEDPLELFCERGDPILPKLFQAFISAETEDEENALVHLRIVESNKPSDLYMRAAHQGDATHRSRF
ncbi:hypothetical protein N9H39_04565 [Gammaproteobacteria bacterium]|nr:hypothetical protein [Gammaproteobacteria bacterium]